MARVPFSRPILAACAAAALHAPAVHAGDDAAYWQSGKPGIAPEYADWMAGINDLSRLQDLSLPGTHDSLSTSALRPLGIESEDSPSISLRPPGVRQIARTQGMSLLEQLESGVRVLDIRLTLEQDQLYAYHGVLPLNADFPGVLRTVDAFLDAHPREAVLMLVRREGESRDSTLEFDAAVARDLQAWGGTHVWYPTTTRTPTLGETRGRVLVLQDFPGVEVGLPYADAQIQDDYELHNIWSAYAKWERVKAQLETTSRSRGRGMFINYLSGSNSHGVVFPFFVAGGRVHDYSDDAPHLPTGRFATPASSTYPDYPRDHCVLDICMIMFEGVNELTGDYLQQHWLAFTGIVMADFPGADLITRVVGTNTYMRERQVPAGV